MARGYNPDSDGIFWAQMLVTLAFYVLYLIVLVWKRPYIDMIHMIVDAALTLLNLITLLLSLLAIQADSGTQDALQWIVLVVQIPCMFLVIVAYCWSSMFYAGYTSPKQFFCCEGKPQIEGDDKLIESGAGGGGTGSTPQLSKTWKKNTVLLKIWIILIYLPKMTVKSRFSVRKVEVLESVGNKFTLFTLSSMKTEN